MAIVLFFAAKIALYTLWCWFGIRLLAPGRRNARLVAFGLAVLRIVLGLALGFAWAFAASYVAPNEEYSRAGFDPAKFIVVFFVLRLLQWSFISWLIRLGTEQNSFLGNSGRDWLWRWGGVAISFAGDLFGVILYLGFVGIVC